MPCTRLGHMLWKLADVERQVTIDHANRQSDLQAAEVGTPLGQVEHHLELVGQEAAAA